MRTTIDIQEHLLERARLLAAASGRRLSDVVNDSLLAFFDRIERSRHNSNSSLELPTCGTPGGQLPFDPTDNQSMWGFLDEEFRNPVTGQLDTTKLR